MPSFRLFVAGALLAVAGSDALIGMGMPGDGGGGQALAALPSESPIQATPEDDQAIRDALGLRGYALREVGVRADTVVPGRVFIDADLGAGPTTLVLDRQSVRSDNFQLTLHGDFGSQAATPPAVTTFQGFDATTGAPAAATIVDGRVSAAVRPENGEAMFIQPASEAGVDAGAGVHVVYAASDVRTLDWRCASDEMACPDCGVVSSSLNLRGPGCAKTVEIVFDADYPFYQQNGSSASATTTDIETIVNQMNVIYQRDLNLRFTVTGITIRTSAATDPYNALGLSAISPNAILNALGGAWAGIPTPARDLVHLMTGRDLQSSVIGIAWVGVVCRSPGNNTGVSQSKFTSNLAMRTVLTAHEIGHNFGSSHDSGGSYIMAPSTSPNSQSQFSPASISVINSFVASYSSCLSTGGPTAGADSAQTLAPAPVLIDVLANDAAGCGGTLTLSLTTTTTSAGGSVAISTGTGPGGRNQIRYTPPASVPAAGINDAFTYRVSESGSSTSATGNVGVWVAGQTNPDPCPGDYNASGGVSVQDIFDFLSDYFSSVPAADVNHSGGITVQDIFDYLQDHFRGCP